MTIRPLADRVLIQTLEEAEQTQGGIFIPDSAKEKPLKGIVIAVGAGKLDGDTRVPLEVAVDDVIFFTKYSGIDIKTTDGTYKILNESDILAVLS